MAAPALVGRLVRIPSPPACGTGASELHARLCARADRGLEGPFARGVVFLHGFPDVSLDHRRESLEYGELRGIAKKLANATAEELPDALFVAFNFTGTPGSDAEVPFCDKTVSREVADVRAAVRFLREGLLPGPAPIHIVGHSTGAIIASLLRGCDPHLTVSVAAGLLDVHTGLHYDFNQTQLEAFDKQGWCLKEFWLPAGSPSNPPLETPQGPAAKPGKWTMSWLRLNARYREDYLQLDIGGAVGESRTPFLVAHGNKDTIVPLAAGKSLFAAAAEPKHMLEIAGADHLLLDKGHFKQFTKAFADHARTFGGPAHSKY